MVLLMAPFLFLLTLQVRAQKNFQVRHFEEAKGISSNFTEAITQGPTGHIIIASKGGVDRFEGKTFERTVLAGDTIGLDYVTSIHRTESEIWLGMFDGRIGLINDEISMISTGISQQIKHIYKDEQAAIWAFSKSGMVLCASGKDTSRFNLSERDILINAVIPYKNKEFIIGSNEGLWLIRFETGNDFQVLRRVDGLPETKITALKYEVEKDRLWVGTEDAGLYLVRSPFTVNQSVKPFVSPSGSSLDDVHTIFGDEAGRIWLGTFGNGLVRIEFYGDGEFDFVELRFEEELDNQLLIKDIFEDDEGNIWIATFGAGIFQIVENAFHQPFSEKWLKEQSINQLYRDSKNNVWLGIDKGIFKTSDHAGRSEFKYYHVGGNQITAIVEDSLGKIWVGTENSGIFTLPAGSDNFVPIAIQMGNLENSINHLAANTQGVYASTKAGLFQFSLDQRLMMHLTTIDGLPHNNVKYSFVDNTGKLWIASQGNRVAYVWQKKIQFVESGDAQRIVDVNHVLQDRLGRLWFSTMGNGVIVLEDGTANVIDQKVGLPSDYCYQMVLDNDGFVWISHQKSITQISPEFKVSRIVGREEISSSENSAVSFLFKDKEGNIWISSTHNVVKFNPFIDKSSKKPPRLSISAMRVSGQNQPMRTGLNLPYNKYEIEFQLAGISLRNPEGVKYKYQLQGLSDTWLIMEGSDRLHNTLGAGTYKLTVYASKNGGEWTEEPVVYEFSIASPFWMTWWFWSLLGLAMLTGLISFVRYRTYRLIKDKTDLEQIVTERTVEIQEQKTEIERSRDEIAKYAKDITDSIKYANRIQQAIFPSWREVQEMLPECFVFFQAKDLVSGDFYFAEKVGPMRIFGAVDCTGHGVPGGFMSIVTNNLLQQAIKQVGLTKPSDILEYCNLGVSNTLHQTYEESSVKDGMDIALCTWHTDTNVLEYAGAYNPLFIFRDGKLMEFKGNRFPVGTFVGEEIRQFTNHSIPVRSEDMVYVFSDGFSDQFGGPNGKKFMIRRFRKMLLEVHTLPLEQQQQAILNQFVDWKGNLEQIDDIVIMGVRIP
jgi:ligand-binding sensor domain-containing protein/serine phosphatase RsbU (regulator of sigma subunit)